MTAVARLPASEVELYWVVALTYFDGVRRVSLDFLTMSDVSA